MNDLNSSKIIQEFGSRSKSFRIIINSLDSFIESNSNQSLNFDTSSAIKKFILYQDNSHFVLKMYLKLLIERILVRMLIDQRISYSKEEREFLFTFLFTKEFFFSPELNDSSLETNSKLNSMEILLYCIQQIDEILSKFTLSTIHEDLFGDIYQNLFQTETRHSTGEYYTPKWLVDQIITDIWPAIINRINQNNQIKILDPSCGSGSFLLALLNIALQNGLFTSIDEIFSSIHGFDINDLSLFMTKSSFILVILTHPSLLLNKEKIAKSSPFLKLDTILINNTKNSLLKYLETSTNEEIFNGYDVIIGNPPWITLKSIEKQDYQEKIKNEFFKYKLIKKSQTHLFTQLEIAALFYCKAIDLYLKTKGIITFVMPKSVMLGTSHNQSFQQFTTPKSKLLKIWDLQNIPNLFGMPTCVLFGQKGVETTYPVISSSFKIKQSQDQNKSNQDCFEITKAKYFPPGTKINKSIYYDKFKVGASIFPRNLYFIRIKNRTENYIKIITDISINQISKKQWKNISLQGIVDEKFLFYTLLAWELLPFGYLHFRPIILPININLNEIHIVSLNQMDKNTKKWFEETNYLWIKNSTEKSKIRFPSLNDRLNYNNLLIKQSLKRFIVLYSGTGTNICSCVIDRNKITGQLDKRLIFIADVKTWIFETEIEAEAYYLSAVLNSPILNQLIKPLQPQGLGGGRAIHRRPLQFPIPQFEINNPDHNLLAKISLQTHKIIHSHILEDYIKNRKQARNIVKNQLEKINNLTKRLLE